MEAKQASRRKILMFPWLGYGHISPCLELAKTLSRHNFHVYLCSSPANLHGIRSRLSQSFSSSLELVELHLPSLPDLPSHMHTTSGLPSHLIPSLFEALDMAAPHFSTILQKLNPDLLISDIFQSWAVELASSLNIPVTTFIANGASFISYLVHQTYNQNSEFPFPEMNLQAHWISKTQNLSEQIKAAVCRFVKWQQSQHFCSNIILMNSFTEIEGKYLDYLSILLNKKVIPVAQLVEEVASTDEKKSDVILDWLDKKPLNSTVYISIGSECSLSKEDREELAYGLELSGVNFIWVLRFPKGEKISMEEALPEGFIQRVGDRGMVVDGWAPQIMKILKHSSTCGFVSHCGWNSMLEAVASALPIVALPLNFDHAYHAKAVVTAGVAVEAERDKEGRIRREGVATAIKEVVLEKRGEDLRRKVREIGEMVKRKQVESIPGLVAELEQLCEGR